MNFIQVMGGLGNQLFQYVFSKYIESLTGKESVLYTGFFDIDFDASNISKRDFSLDKFNANYTIAKDPITCTQRITDEQTIFDPQTDNAFFSGYWQNIDYYKNVSEQIADDLTIKSEYLSDEVIKIADEMTLCESVCLHVRRADYLNKFNNNIFCELSLEYYKAAVDLMIEKLSYKPTLYIFSDDYEYTSNNMAEFRGCNTVFIKPHKDYEDLYLMTRAKHHIIANSTYSYWGALLSDYKHGITIAPKRWFKDRKDPHLYPDNWLVLDNITNKPLISIVIPAHNVEKYVTQCLRCIEDQTYGMENFEVIIVNDASTDNTLEHLKEFESKHPNEVILINLEESAGCGGARNIGVSYANGSYISFIDSDDLVDICMFEKMVITMNDYDCDFVECGYKQFKNESDIHVTTNIPRSIYLHSDSYEDQRQFTVFSCTKTSVWGRLYKKSFIDKYTLRFIENVVYEDIPYTGITLFLADSYCRLNETLYFYRYNNEGIIFSEYRSEKTHQAVTMVEKFLEELCERDLLDTILKTRQNNLIEYCTSKAFVDPLSTILLSNLDINEIFKEIAIFKKFILSLFPGASSSLSLSDRISVYKLGKYLLDTELTVTQKLFCNDNNTGKLTVIEVNQNLTSDIYLDIIKTKNITYSERPVIKLSYYDFDNERLLIKHALKSDDIIAVSIGRYCCFDDQKQAESCICSVLNDCPDQHIILLMHDLYYNETNESLERLANVTELIKYHPNITLIISNEVNYAIAKKIMPNIHIDYYDFSL